MFDSQVINVSLAGEVSEEQYRSVVATVEAACDDYDLSPTTSEEDAENFVPYAEWADEPDAD